MDDIVFNIKQKMQVSQKKAKEYLRIFKVKQSQNSNKKIQTYQVNDLVLLKIEARNKLDPLWKDLFEIMEVKSPNVVIQEIGKRNR